MAIVYGLCRESDQTIRYIGITNRTITKRFREHLSDARLNPIYPVHKWMAKYEDVKYIVLYDKIDFESAKAIEIQEIELRNNLLNLSTGGEGSKGCKHTEEFKNKLSIMKKGIKRPCVECPVCNKIVDIGNAKRWHFENCGQPRQSPANKGALS